MPQIQNFPFKNLVCPVQQTGLEAVRQDSFRLVAFETDVPGEYSPGSSVKLNAQHPAKGMVMAMDAKPTVAELNSLPGEVIKNSALVYRQWQFFPFILEGSNSTICIDKFAHFRMSGRGRTTIVPIHGMPYTRIANSSNDMTRELDGCVSIVTVLVDSGGEELSKNPCGILELVDFVAVWCPENDCYGTVMTFADYQKEKHIRNLNNDNKEFMCPLCRTKGKTTILRERIYDSRDRKQHHGPEEDSAITAALVNAIPTEKVESDFLPQVYVTYDASYGLEQPQPTNKLEEELYNSHNNSTTYKQTVLPLNRLDKYAKIVVIKGMEEQRHTKCIYRAINGAKIDNVLLVSPKLTAGWLPENYLTRTGTNSGAGTIDTLGWSRSVAIQRRSR